MKKILLKFSAFIYCLLFAFPLATNAFGYYDFKEFVHNFWEQIFPEPLVDIPEQIDPLLYIKQNQNYEFEIWTYQYGEDAFTWAVSSFEQEYPNVKINFRTYSTEESLWNALQQGGDLPDIFMIKDSWLPYMWNISSPAPKDLYQISDIETGFLPASKTAFCTETKVWAIPLYLRVFKMFYNSSFLEDDRIALGDKPGETWVEFLNNKNKYDELGKTKTSFVSVGAKENYPYTKDLFILLLLQGESGDNLPNSSVASDALNYLTLLYTPFFDKEVSYLDAFEKNRLGVTFSYDEIGNLFTGVPQLNTEKPLYLAEMWGFAVSSKSSNINESWEIIKFLTNERNRNDFFLKTNKNLINPVITNENKDFLNKLVVAGKWNHPDFLSIFNKNFEKLLKKYITTKEALINFDNFYKEL